MIPIEFPQANHRFGPPEGMNEEQVRTIHAHVHEVQGGGNDGIVSVTCAWLPSAKDLERIMNGGPIFVTMFGGLAPHCITSSFEDAANIK